MRAYRALLALYPASFRAEYAREMEGIFARRLRDASGLPALLLLVRYVPRRLDQIRNLTAASRVLLGGDARLVAMRAAFSLPYGVLLAYTEDPLGDLRAERYDALLLAAYEEAGLQPRPPTASASAPRPQPAGRPPRSAST